MKRIIFILLIILLIPSFSFASKEPVVVEYFGVDACLTCVKAERHMDRIFKELEDEGYRIQFISHKITNPKSEQRLIELNNALGVEDLKYKLIPAIFIGDRYLIDFEDIERDLKNLIIDVAENGFGDVEISDTNFRVQSLTLGGIFFAGLLDGINPCSIAMMLFFISIIMADIKNKKKNAVLKLGLSFSAGVLVAYFGIGVGLFNFIYRISNLADIMFGFYFLLFVMAIVLMILNLKDYYHIVTGNEKKIKNQLSKKTKKQIHTFIRKMAAKKSNSFYIVAFIVAFVISFMEFFCTGQIYLPTITYMIKNTNNFSYLFLLILYNIAFILPLLSISFFLDKGREVIDISSILLNKLHIIKLSGAIFFLIVIIYSANQMKLLV